MAIVAETYKVGERDFVRTYSDLGMKIYGGVPEGNYAEACDPAELNRTYTETNIPIEGGDETAEEIVDILTGESE